MSWGYSRWRLSSLGSRRREGLFAGVFALWRKTSFGSVSVSENAVFRDLQKIRCRMAKGSSFLTSSPNEADVLRTIASDQMANPVLGDE